MTESEWMSCNQVWKMLLELRRRKGPWKWSTRKARLFGCGCCRRVWSLIDSGQHQAIELAEQVADKQMLLRSLASARRAWPGIRLGADPAPIPMSYWSSRSSVSWNFFVNCSPESEYFCNPGAALCAPVAWGDTYGAANDCRALRYFRENEEAAVAEERAQCDLLRELVGTTRTRPHADPGWLGSGTRALAQAIYDERELPSGCYDTGRVAILADALEEAGCTDQEILHHCRNQAEHVRGCWVVDLVLGKE
jgi:hypothetical protein